MPMEHEPQKHAPESRAGFWVFQALFVVLVTALGVRIVGPRVALVFGAVAFALIMWGIDRDRRRSRSR